MNIDLTKKELEYLRHRPFFDWQYAQIDTMTAELQASRKDAKSLNIKAFKKAEKWYKDLYIKLGGKVK